MANYPIPPWIRPPQNLAGEYAAGAALGAKIAMERERANQERQMFAIETQVRSEQAHQRALEHQQELQVEKAYHDQQLALRDRALAQQQTVIAVKNQQTARQFAAQQRFRQMVEAGEDPDKAALQIGPELFGSMAGFAGVAREVYQRGHPFVPTTKTVDGVKMVQESPNRWARVPAPSTVSGEPLRLQPILDPNGRVVAGAGAYSTGTGGARPFVFPKVVDPNKKAIEEMEKGPYGEYLTGLRELPKDKQLKMRVEAAMARYKELKAGGGAAAPGFQYQYNPATKKIEPVASKAHTEAEDEEDY